jgi:ankyrin repeat protein
MVKLLVVRDIDLEAKARRETTALHLAAAGGHHSVVKAILEVLRSKK